MADTVLRTGAYIPKENEEGAKYRTQFFPDGSAIIVNENGVSLIERGAPYLFSVARPAEQALPGNWSGHERRDSPGAIC